MAGEGRDRWPVPAPRPVRRRRRQGPLDEALRRQTQRGLPGLQRGQGHLGRLEIPPSGGAAPHLADGLPDPTSPHLAEAIETPAETPAEPEPAPEAEVGAGVCVHGAEPVGAPAGTRQECGSSVGQR